MDEAVIQYYKRLLKNDFPYAGSFADPSIYLTYDNSKGVLCGNAGDNLHLYVGIRNGVVEKIRYLCICDPTTNVVVETLCTLAENRPLADVENLTEEDFSRLVKSRGEEFLKKARIVIEFLREKIRRN